MNNQQTTNEAPVEVIAAVIETFKAHRSALPELERIAREAADAARDAYNVLEQETVKVERLKQWLEEQTKGRHPLAVPRMVEQHRLIMQEEEEPVGQPAVTRLQLIIDYLNSLGDSHYIRLYGSGGSQIRKWYANEPDERIEDFDTVDFLTDRVTHEHSLAPVIVGDTDGDEVDRILAYLRRKTDKVPEIHALTLFADGNGYIDQPSVPKMKKGETLFFNRVEDLMEEVARDEQEAGITND